MFTSTIGNINTYMALVGMVTAAIGNYYLQQKTNGKTVFLLLRVLISFCLNNGISDNAYYHWQLIRFPSLYLFKDKKGSEIIMMLATFFGNPMH